MVGIVTLALSRMALGGAMLYAGYDLAGRGRITGAGPADTGQRNDLARGWQEFGLRIGKDEISAENVKRLNDLIPGGIVEGTGGFWRQLLYPAERARAGQHAAPDWCGYC